MSRAFTVLFAMLSISVSAQQKIRSIEVSDTILSVSVDRPGDFYVVTKSGQIQKYDKNGNLVVLYRSEFKPTLFDPRDGARLFAYFRQPQNYTYYNPSFDITASYHVDPAFAIEPWLICPSGDHKLWILDKADNTLKKLNAPHTEVEIEVVIDTALIEDASSFVHLRDYQGFVFALAPARGIYVFNGIGNYIRTLPVSGIDSFNFLGEELYYLRGDQIILFNLYTAESRQIAAPGRGIAAVLTDERMMIVHPRSVDLYEFTP